MEWTADYIKKKYEFDTVGITKHKGETLIILGMETEPDRNLDEFIGGEEFFIKGEKKTTWCFSGFKKYFSPVVDKFLTRFENIGENVKPLEDYDKSINFRELAIKAGIGIQGRNTLVMNSKFQSRLRFLVVKTTTDLELTGDGVSRKRGNTHCDECRLCELVCPVNALKDYKLIYVKKCIAHQQLTKRTPNLVRCNLCWRACTKDLYWAKQKQKEKELLKRLMLPK